MTQQIRPFVLWAGIRGPLLECEGPEAKEACAQMRDGKTIQSAGVELVAVRTDEDLSYGLVLDVFDQPPVMQFNRGTTHFPISRAKTALAELGITGPVEMRLQEAVVARADA